MTRTLILMFHRDIANSKANAALAQAARTLSDVDLVDMQARFPHGIDPMRDSAAEAALLHRADRLVFQFPIQWYSVPGLMKDWIDAVLTRMFYIIPEEGERLRGMPLMVAATAGNVPEAYSPSGANLFPMEQMLTPLRATASRCGFVWNAPFIVFRADELSPEERAAAGRDYCMALATFASRSSISQHTTKVA